MIHHRHSKTPYELLHNKPPNLSYLYAFGALYYPTNDSKNLGKLQPKADIGIFIGYAPTKKAFRIYNRLTRRIIETIHVDFDELTAMASEHSSLGPTLHEMTTATISSGLVPNPPPLYCQLHLLTPIDPEVVAPIDVVAAIQNTQFGNKSTRVVMIVVLLFLISQTSSKVQWIPHCSYHKRRQGNYSGTNICRCYHPFACIYPELCDIFAKSWSMVSEDSLIAQQPFARCGGWEGKGRERGRNGGEGGEGEEEGRRGRREEKSGE
ncbi:retrovirus-related pol polyprotein from transposon TNT 1-94 [Tanacetum coccineum]